MDLAKPQTIEEIVLQALSQKALSGEALLLASQNLKPGFTKQALYQLLRKLIEREIVIKHGKQYSLSQIWLLRMNDFFSLAQKQYGIGEQGSNDFLSLSDGDKISYSFKSPADADKFWGHAFSVLGSSLVSEPLYIYNPHDWFLLARTESEAYLFEELKRAHKQVWLICGGDTALDKYVKKYFDGQLLQYYMISDGLFEARNYYLNIFGDYIIEARLDEKTTEAIDRLYQNTDILTPSVEEQLKAIVSHGKTQITISRNKNKSDKLKRLFTPYFYKI